MLKKSKQTNKQTKTHEEKSLSSELNHLSLSIPGTLPLPHIRMQSPKES
jgi:hypothetical protein